MKERFLEKKLKAINKLQFKSLFLILLILLLLSSCSSSNLTASSEESQTLANATVQTNDNSQIKEKKSIDTFSWFDGTSYEGEWKNNQIDGRGTITYANGDKYTGEFSNSLKNGTGIYIWVNGEEYEGAWTNDKMHGHGVYKFINGDVYDGNWANSLMDGNGTYKYANGGTLSGTWSNNSYKGIGSQSVKKQEVNQPSKQSITKQPIITTTESKTISLGSTKEIVRNIMGEPTSIIYDTWSYGLSSITFNNNKVNGWSNIEQNLKVNIGNRITNPKPFSLNSKIDDVINSMGTPTSIIYDTWSYGLSTVTFNSAKKVNGWSNIEGNLNVGMGNKKSKDGYFEMGSNKQDVINAMGTPTSIIYDTWSYGLSTISFNSASKVTGWSDIENNLKVK